MKAMVLILVVGVAHGQVPLYERDSAQTRFLVKCSGKTVDEIDQLGDLRNFEDVASFLAARHQFIDQCIDYILKNPHDLPQGITVTERGSVRVQYTAIPALARTAECLDTVGIDLRGVEHSDDVAGHHFKVGVNQDLLVRGFPYNELTLLASLTDEEHDKHAYMRQHYGQLKVARAVYLNSIKGEVRDEHAITYGMMGREWGRRIKDEWVTSVLMSLTPKARNVLVSYLFEPDHFGSGTTTYSAPVRSPEEIASTKERLNLFRSDGMK